MAPLTPSQAGTALLRIQTARVHLIRLIMLQRGPSESGLRGVRVILRARIVLAHLRLRATLWRSSRDLDLGAEAPAGDAAGDLISPTRAALTRHGRTQTSWLSEAAGQVTNPRPGPPQTEIYERR